MKTIKVNITINEDLLNKIDSYSKKRFISRSGLISLALSYFLDNVVNVPISAASDSKPLTDRFEE